MVLGAQRTQRRKSTFNIPLQAIILFRDVTSNGSPLLVSVRQDCLYPHVFRVLVNVGQTSDLEFSKFM